MGKKIAFYDFDQTLSKDHTFRSHCLKAPLAAEEYAQHKLMGKKNAVENIKCAIQHDNNHISAIATYHNNPAFIAGFISQMLNKKLKLVKTIHTLKAPIIAIDVYTVKDVDTPFLISYIPDVGEGFKATMTSLTGKNEQIHHLRSTLVEMGHISSTDMIDFYDDTLVNFLSARQVPHVTPYLVSTEKVFSALSVAEFDAREEVQAMDQAQPSAAAASVSKSPASDSSHEPQKQAHQYALQSPTSASFFSIKDKESNPHPASLEASMGAMHLVNNPQAPVRQPPADGASQLYSFFDPSTPTPLPQTPVQVVATAAHNVNN